MNEGGAQSLGQYLGRDIPAWIDVAELGGRHSFVGIAREDADGSVPLMQLGPTEIVVSPGLIYRLQEIANV